MSWERSRGGAGGDADGQQSRSIANGRVVRNRPVNRTFARRAESTRPGVTRSEVLYEVIAAQAIGTSVLEGSDSSVAGGGGWAGSGVLPGLRGHGVGVLLPAAEAGEGIVGCVVIYAGTASLGSPELPGTFQDTTDRVQIAAGKRDSVVGWGSLFGNADKHGGPNIGQAGQLPDEPTTLRVTGCNDHQATISTYILDEGHNYGVCDNHATGMTDLWSGLEAPP